MQRKQQNNFAHKSGPHNSLPKTNGFHENFKRPVGGGRNGLVFGSLRAAPTAITVALSFGQIWMLQVEINKNQTQDYPKASYKTYL